MALSSRFALLGWDDLGTLATPTSSITPQTGFPLTNLQNESLFSRVRGPAGSLSSVNFDFDLGSSKTVAAFALAGANFSLGATMTVKSSTVSNFATTVHDSGSIDCFDDSLGYLIDYAPPWGRIALWCPTAGSGSARYVRFTITDTGNADNYLEFAFAVIGDLWQPATDIQNTWARIDRHEGESGAEKILRGLQVSWKSLTVTERVKLASLVRGLGLHGRVLAIPKPDQRSEYLDGALWARIENAFDADLLLKKSSDERWTVPMTFREVDR